jgi:hypothetical protein
MISLTEHASSMTSQYGENGIIKKIFEEIGTENAQCVEFGAYDLTELSNVYPLWAKNGWDALLIEGDSERFEQLYSEYKKHENTENVQIVEGFVSTTGENSLDSYLERYDMSTKLDLISIDVDGMDYHIWDALTEHRPRVVIIEYNPTIPPWKRVIGSSTGNDIGASIQAAFELGNSKGYDLVALTRSNAIFIHQDESHCFESRNDLHSLYDFESHGTNIRYAGHTYDGEIFFDGPPTHGRHYTFARSQSVEIENTEQFYFAGSPSPRQPIRYFFWYPLIYFLTQTVFKDMIALILEWLNLKPIFRSVYYRLKDY